MEVIPQTNPTPESSIARIYDTFEGNLKLFRLEEASMQTTALRHLIKCEQNSAEMSRYPNRHQPTKGVGGAERVFTRR